HALGIRAADFTLKADPEQAVHYEPAFVGTGHIGGDIAPGSTRRVERRLRILRELLPVPTVRKRDVEPPALEMSREHERIAAVVAGAGEHDDGSAAVAGDFARKLGGSETGP